MAGGDSWWEYTGEGVRIRREYDSIRDRKMVSIRVLTEPGSWITLYTGPFPPTDADVLAHWNTLVARALGAEDEK